MQVFNERAKANLGRYEVTTSEASKAEVEALNQRLMSKLAVNSAAQKPSQSIPNSPGNILTRRLG